MYQSHDLQPSRRNFLRRAATIGVAGCLGAHRAVTATPPPLETTTIRLVHAPSICTAPQYIAEEFLRLDGFTDVQYTCRWERETAPTRSPTDAGTSPCGTRLA